MEEAFVTVMAFFIIIGCFIWVVGNTAKGVKSVGRTTKAIGKWVDKQLEEDK